MGQGYSQVGLRWGMVRLGVLADYKRVLSCMGSFQEVGRVGVIEFSLGVGMFWVLGVFFIKVVFFCFRSWGVYYQLFSFFFLRFLQEERGGTVFGVVFGAKVGFGFCLSSNFVRGFSFYSVVILRVRGYSIVFVGFSFRFSFFV